MEEPSNLIDPDFGYTSWDEWDETPSPDNYFIKQNEVITGLSETGKLAEQINLPSKPMRLAAYAFDDCACKRLVISSDYWEYGEGVPLFRGSSIKYIKCNSIEYIHEAVNDLSNMPSLVGIYIPDGVEFIQDNFFNGSENLRFVRFPDGLKEIKEYAFIKTGIKNINYTAGSDALIIGDYCFQSMPNLKNVHIKACHIGTLAFGSNEALENMIVEGDCNNFLDSNATQWAYNCYNLKKIKLLMKNLKSFDLLCFWNCNNLQALILPEDLESINGVWTNPSTYLYIPKKAKFAGSFSFNGFPLSKHVYIHPDNVDTWNTILAQWKNDEVGFNRIFKKGILSYNTNPKFWIRGVWLSDFLIRDPYSTDKWEAYGLTEIGKTRKTLTLLNKVYYFDIENTDNNWKNNVCKKLIFNKNFSEFDSGEKMQMEISINEREPFLVTLPLI